MPYSHVVKESSSSTKVQIVYDCSAPTAGGPSLNEVMYSGPKLMVDLIPLLIRFRTYPFALSADITRFFNQIAVANDHQDFQRLIFREDTTMRLQHYRMSRLTFGVTASPFLASSCLFKLCEDENESERVKQIIHQETLVDNILTGSFSISEAITLPDELSSLISKGQMELRKWASNSDEVLGSIPEDKREIPGLHIISEDISLPTLGQKWNPTSDKFMITIPTSKNENSATKRTVLSQIAKIYDPLGWLGPVTIPAKLPIQKLWKAKLDWDTVLPPPHMASWKSIARDLTLLKEFSIPRCYMCSTIPPALKSSPGSLFIPHYKDYENLTYDLFGFSDASNVAYSAVSYLRATFPRGEVTISLIGTKTKVAPVKGDTVPRLELNGARLLSRFTRTILDNLNLPVASTTCFSDSTSVLGQLHPNSKEIRDVYTRNRVRTIQDLLPTTPWNHVNGIENPADCASRGISAREFLNHKLYFQGPPWLPNFIPPSQVLYCHSLHTRVLDTDPIIPFMRDFNSIQGMKRGVAEKFIQDQSNPPSEPTVSELKEALQLILKSVQQESFPAEIENLENDTPVPSNSIKKLAPFFDSEGVLRVGGRLSQAKLHHDAKHQILLPKSHQFTTILANDYHVEHLHAGPTLLLSLFREKYWILSGSAVCKRTVRNCLVCFEANPKPLQQLMGDLPEVRVNLSRPFAKTGMDFCGHVTLCVTPGRRPRLTKSYVCVFVCMAVKAVHLEMVSDLSTPAFLAALQRFVSRRGLPSDLYSDSGTNSKGTRTELNRVRKFLNSDELQDTLTHYGEEKGFELHFDQGTNFLADEKELKRVGKFLGSSELLSALTNYGADEKIDFHFNPPRSLAPHHGGLFEAAAKSAKYHLRRVVGDRHLSHEAFQTLLAQVEAVLNLRPITPMSSDPSDFSSLTPAHFLVGGSLHSIPAEDLTSVKENQLTRWQRTQKVYQEFWKRFCAEYLQTLQS